MLHRLGENTFRERTVRKRQEVSALWFTVAIFTQGQEKIYAGHSHRPQTKLRVVNLCSGVSVLILLLLSHSSVLELTATFISWSSLARTLQSQWVPMGSVTSHFTHSLCLARLFNTPLLIHSFLVCAFHSQPYAFILYIVKRGKGDTFSKVYKIKCLLYYFTDLKSELKKMKVIFEPDVPSWVSCLWIGILNFVFFY